MCGLTLAGGCRYIVDLLLPVSVSGVDNDK